MPDSKKTIVVHIHFPLRDKPLSRSYASETTMTTLLADAFTEFGITPDGQTRYYMSHDNKEVPDVATLASIAGHAGSVQLYLVKITIAG